jgi:hypothetical protein
MGNEPRVYVSFDSWAFHEFLPPIRSYSELLLQRVLPIFDDLDGEAKRVEQEVLSWPWEESNYDEAFQTARELSVEQVWEFMELRSVFLATGVSGLHHLFEKQVYKHLNRELRCGNAINDWNIVSIIFEKLKNKVGFDVPCTDLKDRISEKNIQELRLVANAIKHGEGRSLKKLKKMSAPVVSNERLEEDCDVGPRSILGVDISINSEYLIRYTYAITKFWEISGTYWTLYSDIYK